MAKSRRVFSLESKAVGDPKDGRIHAILSTESADRYGDVIRQDGWVLDNFSNHPVLLAGHNYRDITAQIGEWEDVKVTGPKSRRQLEATARYYVGEGNAQADWAYAIARKGKAAYSVGFEPIEYSPRSDVPSDEFWGPWEFQKQDLLEASHVNVPANQDALQNALTAQSFDQRTAEIIEAAMAAGAPQLEGTFSAADFARDIAREVSRELRVVVVGVTNSAVSEEEPEEEEAESAEQQLSQALEKRLEEAFSGH